MLEIIHVFKDGSHDPSKKTVPADIVRRVHEIRVRAEADLARRQAAAAAAKGEDVQ